jgi:hypothetical protein
MRNEQNLHLTDVNLIKLRDTINFFAHVVLPTISTTGLLQQLTN